MKFLIIDDLKSIRALLKNQLQKKWPDARVDLIDPANSTISEKKFNWSHYDVVLLDYDLGLGNQTGIDFLPKIKQSEKAPIVIMVTGQGNEEIAVKAIKLGADDYLIKYDVVTDKLYDVIIEAVALRQISENLTKINQNQNSNARLPFKNGKKPYKGEYLNQWNIPGYGCIFEVSTKIATTLLAERRYDNKLVILKVQKTQNINKSQLFNRFIQELNILASLEHPNLMKILDHGVTGQYIYYAMDYLESGDLELKIDQGKINPDTATEYVFQIANGLEALHTKNIIHRDIKPSNILFTRDDIPVITDLGVAKNLASEESFTMQGEILGTPYYISPEQFTDKKVDNRSDLYSLGIMFHEMLTGQRPFQGDTIMELVFKHTYEKPVYLPKELNRFQPIIDKLIAKEPDKRYQDISQFKNALAKITDKCPKQLDLSS